MTFEHTHDPATGTVRGATRGGASVLPKILAVVAIINLLRMVAAHKRGNGAGASWRERRKAMVAELHRELHRADEQSADATEASAKA